MPTTGKSGPHSFPISLYFHVPFCLKKCPYCHFYSVFPKEEAVEKYEKAVLLHLKQAFKTYFLDFSSKAEIVSVYFGGGTPSLLKSSFFAKILETLAFEVSIDKNCEITIEANPFQLSFQKLADLKGAGINRLSLGVQSFDDRLLQILQRKHTSKEAEKTVFAAYKAGLQNISLDLMYEIPSQTKQQFLNSVKKTLALPVSHLSLYNLTFEEGTVFFKDRDRLKRAVLKETDSLKSLKRGLQMLRENGFQQYEISAFAKNSLVSRHNLGYWTARPFLGFGPSAFSYFEKKRFQNFCSLEKYCRALEQNRSAVSFTEQLPYPQNMKEQLAINLRVLKGVRLQDFQKRHGNLDQQTRASIDSLLRRKLLTEKKDLLKLSFKGLFFYDLIAQELI